MQPHPEGGFYVETYRSTDYIFLPMHRQKAGEGRNWSAGILFLLKTGDYSHFHCFRQDGMWPFYLGNPMRLAMLHPDGSYEEVISGQDILTGQSTVPAGIWFGTTPCDGTAFLSVVPGFASADFELAKKQELLSQYP